MHAGRASNSSGRRLRTCSGGVKGHILRPVAPAFARALCLVSGLVLTAAFAPAIAAPPLAPPPSFDELARSGNFSGAVVIRGAEEVRFARGYGLADPFTDRRFTPDTPVDSASLAKPITAAAVLVLAHDGSIDLDAPVQRYISDFPYAEVTVRHLLAHSAGLPVEEMVGPLEGKTNAMFLAEMEQRKLPLLFSPGSTFVYCNLCYTSLALLIEQVTGQPYLEVVRTQTGLPAAVTLRPAALNAWKDRAIGYRRAADGKPERADSYENELFYGAANFSVSAAQLAQWGTEWWKPRLAPIKNIATTSAMIAGKPSGLSWGNWYCAPGGRQCHYLGHHEGFHHMLYWDDERKLSLAMVTNNSLSAALQQRVQRALVATAEGRPADAERELSAPLPERPSVPGTYRFPTGRR